MIGSQPLSSPGSKISLFGSAFCLLVLCCTDVVYTQTTAVIPDDATRARAFDLSRKQWTGDFETIGRAMLR